MSSITIERINSLLLREIADIVQNNLKNSKIGYITLTEVKVKKDLSKALVYYSIIGNEDRVNVTQESLDKSKGYIKTELAKRIKNIRKIPDLNFIYDKSLEYGNRIQKILNDINNE